MIYTGATMDPIEIFHTAPGAKVEVVIVSLTPASDETITALALAADKNALLARMTTEDMACHETEEDLLVAAFLASTEPASYSFVRNYEHSAYCTGCQATADDTDEDLGFRRRVQLTEGRHLILLDRQVAYDWAKQHASTCTAAQPAAA